MNKASERHHCVLIYVLITNLAIMCTGLSKFHTTYLEPYHPLQPHYPQIACHITYPPSYNTRVLSRDLSQQPLTHHENPRRKSPKFFPIKIPSFLQAYIPVPCCRQPKPSPSRPMTMKKNTEGRNRRKVDGCMKYTTFELCQAGREVKPEKKKTGKLCWWVSWIRLID